MLRVILKRMVKNKNIKNIKVDEEVWEGLTKLRSLSPMLNDYNDVVKFLYMFYAGSELKKIEEEEKEK